MSYSSYLLTIVMLIVACDCENAAAQSTKPRPAGKSSGGGLGGPLDFGKMLGGASDLRRAAEAAARWGASLERAAEIGGRSLARMSSEFDPFGYKTAFRVVNRQNAIIEAQSRQIRLLLQQENRRLAKENRALKKALEKRQPPPRGKRKKRRKKRRR